MPAVPAQTSKPTSKVMTAGLLLCVLAVAFENQAVLTAMPAAAEDLGDLHLYAWAFTAVMIPQLIAIAVAGRWCDTAGPLRPFVVGLTLFAVGIVVAALAPTMAVLLAGRVVQGFGAGAINLSLMVVTGQAYAPDVRAQVMTWYSACWMLPSFLGPAIAAWLTSTWSWHWVFWAVLPFVGIGAAFLLPGLTRLPSQDASAHDDHVPVHAAVAVAVGVALLQAAGQNLDLMSLVWAAAGIALLAVWLRPMMPTGFRPLAPGLSSTVVTRTITAGSFFGVQAFMPLMLVQRGEELQTAGLAITVSSAGWMLGSWLQSRAWLRLSRDRIIVAGSVCVGAGLAVTAVGAWLPPTGTWLPIAGLTVAGVGMGLATASGSLVVMQLSPAAELGRNTSSLQVGEMLGNSLLAGLAGTVFAALAGVLPDTSVYGAICTLLTATAALSVVTALRIGHVENHSIVQRR